MRQQEGVQIRRQIEREQLGIARIGLEQIGAAIVRDCFWCCGGKQCGV